MTPARRSALPARRTQLVGRTSEIDAIRERVVHGDRRVVTLTGTGGAGKTTLALEAARAVEWLMPDGAWLVDLFPVRDPASVPWTIAAALGLVDGDRPPLEAIGDHLAARQLLLVLENCEHLLPVVAPIVDQLLDVAPDLRVLATSRAPLRVRDESLFTVRPFEPPPAKADLDHLAAMDAVRLFVERAATASPSFELTEANAEAVASICRRVDGLPLAIELAAAWAAALTPHEIDGRLAAVGLLGGLEAGPTRSGHGIMETTLAWSHALLSPGAQALLRRLAVFAGGFTLEAASAVGSLGVEPQSVLGGLTELITHSLVIHEGGAERSRYRMLAPVAEYAARHLAAAEEAAAASMAHATYFLQLTMPRYADIGQNLPEDIDRVADEHENCLAAIRFAEQAGIAPLRMRLVLNLTELWRVRGPLHLAAAHLEAILTLAPAGSFERGVALGLLSDIRSAIGDYDEGEELARQATVLFEELGHAQGIRATLGEQGIAAAGRGDFEGAIAAYERARPLLDTQPSHISAGYWEAGMGRFRLGLGDLDAAAAHLEAADRHFEQQPSWFHGRVLAMLAVVAHRRGDQDRAQALFARGLASLAAYGARVDAIACLEDMARLAADRGDLPAAATLLAASTALRDATGAAPSVPEGLQRNAAIDRVRTGLAPALFDAAWTVGLGMTLDQAVGFATAPRPVAAVEAGAPGTSVDALTRREREIAELVALGLSNREIADRLVIAPGTVKIHVERILGKLGRTSRVQIATWVQEQRSTAAPEDMPTGRRPA